MAIDHMPVDPSSIMTVISFITFIGILWWTFLFKRRVDFDAAAMLPFADEPVDADLAADKTRSIRHG